MTAQIFDFNTMMSDLNNASSSLPSVVSDMASQITGGASGGIFSVTPTFSSEDEYISLNLNFSTINPNSYYTYGLFTLCSAAASTPPTPNPVQTDFNVTFIIPENYTSPPAGLNCDQLIYLACNGFNGEVCNQSNNSLSQLQYTFPECCCLIQFYQYNQSTGDISLVGRGCTTSGGLFPLLSSDGEIYDISSPNPPSFNFDFAVLFTFSTGGSSPNVTLLSASFFTSGTSINSFSAQDVISTIPENNLSTLPITNGTDGIFYGSIYYILPQGGVLQTLNQQSTFGSSSYSGFFGFSTGSGYHSGIANTNGYSSPSNEGGNNALGTLLSGLFWIGTQYNVNLLNMCYSGDSPQITNGSGSIYTIPLNINNQTAEIIGLGNIVANTSSQNQNLSDAISSTASGIEASFSSSGYDEGGNLNFNITLSGNISSLFTTYVSGGSDIIELNGKTFPSSLTMNFSYPSNSSLEGDWLLRVANPIAFGGISGISSASQLVSISFPSIYFSMQFYKFNTSTSPISIDAVGVATIGTGINENQFDISSPETLISSSFPNFDFALVISYQNSSSTIDISLLSQGVFNLSTIPMNETFINHILQTTQAIFISQYWNGGEYNTLSPSNSSSTYVISNGSGGYTSNILSSTNTSLSPNFIFSTTSLQGCYITSNSSLPSNCNNYSMMAITNVSNAFMNAFLENGSGELNYSFF